MQLSDLKCLVCNRDIFYLREILEKKPNVKLNSPMLTNAAWKKVLNFYNFKVSDRDTRQVVCDCCMQKALNRNLTGEDLRDCEISQSYVKYNNLNLQIPENNDFPQKQSLKIRSN